MRHLVRVSLLLALAAATGCGGGKDSASAPSATATTGSAGGVAAESKYDKGPRAGESPADKALAEKGEGLFKTKGCSACHTFGKRSTGPDLAGVTQRRTAAWMENQILHPDVMTREDPISHRLMGEFALQMPNQGLTPDEAKAVIEYFKHKDQEAGH
jgi:cytochrome c551/c552